MQPVRRRPVTRQSYSGKTAATNLPYPCALRQMWPHFKQPQDTKGISYFCQEAMIDEDQDCPIIAQPGTVSEGGDEPDTSKGWEVPNTMNESEIKLSGTNGDTVITSEREMERSRNNIVTEFLDLHHRAGHISFAKLQTMARQGSVPRKFATCPIPSTRWFLLPLDWLHR